MAGISSKALAFGAPENKMKYNGIEKENDLQIEIYDAQLRELDGQVGIWWQIDPKTENMEMWSPYASNYDNPIRYSDPLGDEGQDCCLTGLLNWVPSMIGRMVDNLDNNIGLATDVKNKALENAKNRLDARATLLHQAIDDPLSFIPDEPLQLIGGPTEGGANLMNGLFRMEGTALKTQLNTFVKVDANVVKASVKVAQAQATKDQGVIYEVPGQGTKSGKPYVGRTKNSDPAKRRSDGGRDRTKAKVVDTYDPNNVQEGRVKEQKKIDEHGLENLDNKRNEIKPPKKSTS